MGWWFSVHSRLLLTLRYSIYLFLQNIQRKWQSLGVNGVSILFIIYKKRPRGDCELVSVANFLPVNHMPDNKMKQTNMAEVCAHGHENTLGITSLHEADELAMDAGSWLHASKVQ